jgi:hypothetical protein
MIALAMAAATGSQLIWRRARRPGTRWPLTSQGCPNRRSDYLAVGFADAGQDVAVEMHPTSLPAGAGEHALHGGFEAFVRVADDHCTRDNPRRFNDRRKVPSAATPARDTTRPPVLRALT